MVQRFSSWYEIQVWIKHGTFSNPVFHCLREARKQLNNIPQRACHYELTALTRTRSITINTQQQIPLLQMISIWIARSSADFRHAHGWTRKDVIVKKRAIQSCVILRCVIKSLLASLWQTRMELPIRNHRWLKHVFLCWPFQAFLGLPTVLTPKRNTIVLSTKHLVYPSSLRWRYNMAVGHNFLKSISCLSSGYGEQQIIWNVISANPSNCLALF